MQFSYSTMLALTCKCRLCYQQSFGRWKPIRLKIYFVFPIGFMILLLEFGHNFFTICYSNISLLQFVIHPFLCTLPNWSSHMHVFWQHLENYSHIYDVFHFCKVNLNKIDLKIERLLFIYIYSCKTISIKRIFGFGFFRSKGTNF